MHTSAGGKMPTLTALATASCPASLVVIVSPCLAERERLAATLPPDVTVLLAPTTQHAQEALQSLPVGEGLGYRLLDDQRAVVFEAGSVRLTPLEFSMLRVLASEPGRVFSFVDLSRAVWATGFVGDGAQVRAVVKRLRRKLGEAGAPVLVETVRAAGLRLTRRPTA